MKIHVVLYSAFDGECSYDRSVKAFTKEDDATEHAKLCVEECERIKSEVDAHYKKHKEELEILRNKIRSVISEKEGIDIRDLPEMRRSLEISNKERDIKQTHKYDPHLRVLEDEYSYVVEELELD